MTPREIQRRTDDVVVRALLPSDVELFRSLRMQALEDSPDANVETLEGARDCDWQARTARLSLSDPAEVVAYVACVGALPIGMVLAGHKDHNDSPFLSGDVGPSRLPSARRRAFSRRAGARLPALLGSAARFPLGHGDSHRCVSVLRKSRLSANRSEIAAPARLRHHDS